MGAFVKSVIPERSLWLAPMAGYTDRAMRVVSHSLGADLSMTEMVSAKAVVYGDKKTHILARIKPDEGPVLLQIFGSEPSIMAEAARILEAGYGEDGYTAPFAIDINMGCPVHKIFGNGEGSALMRDPEKIYDIVKAVSGAISIPCTVKIRAGVDPDHINAVECALAAESAGAALVAVHGRTKSQLYGGIADRKIIKNVKQALHIPVIANGDITDSVSALAMLRDTGADGIMIGRGAVGNPFIFSEIKAALSGGKFVPPTIKERRDMALKQLMLSIEDKGEGAAVVEARKQIANYFKGDRGCAALRAKINMSTTFDEVKAAIDKVVECE
jgi:nifR3 family TIM-barrel protein